MSLSIDEIFAIARNGNLKPLLGEFESSCLDAKSQPYAFDSDMGKREFAKDVAAFANAGGGCIVLGVETERLEKEPVEMLSRLKPFPVGLFNRDQLDKLVAQWLYPIPRKVEYLTLSGDAGPGSVTGAVLVPPQDEKDKPFLIARSIEGTRTSETLIGYAERRLDRTDVKRIAEIHNALRIGMNFGAALSERLDVIEGLIRQGSAPLPAQIPIATINERVERFLAEGPSVSSVRTLLIVVTPAPPSEVSSLFSSEEGSVRRLLERPPELRPNGWGIWTGAPVESIGGERIRTTSQRSAVTVYRDGQFIAGSRIDGGSLAWASRDDSTIHPLALAEFVTNALVFYGSVLQAMPTAPRELRVQVDLRNLQLGNGTTLPDGPIGGTPWIRPGKPAPESSLFREFAVAASSYDAPRVAFDALREVYRFFGYTDGEIPYATGAGSERRVDINEIKSIR